MLSLLIHFLPLDLFFRYFVASQNLNLIFARIRKKSLSNEQNIRIIVMRGQDIYEKKNAGVTLHALVSIQT